MPRLRLRVRNPGNRTQQTTLYAGTIFEVEDPFSGVQNLAICRDVSITVPGGQTQVVEIVAKCLNPRLAVPRNTRMRITSLVATACEAGRRPAAEQTPASAEQALAAD